MQHLSLEQCRKLKEIGFPQDTYLSWYMKIEGEDSESVGRTLPGPRNICACPTLEELIQWLCTTQFRLELQSNRWMAHMKPGYGNSWVNSEGPTPLEAVYNLAIAIKQPNN